MNITLKYLMPLLGSFGYVTNVKSQILGDANYNYFTVAKPKSVIEDTYSGIRFRVVGGLFVTDIPVLPPEVLFQKAARDVLVVDYREFGRQQSQVLNVVRLELDLAAVGSFWMRQTELKTRHFAGSSEFNMFMDIAPNSPFVETLEIRPGSYRTAVVKSVVTKLR